MQTWKELKTKGLIWMGQGFTWYRKCPVCSSDVKYDGSLSRYNVTHDYNENKRCKQCINNSISQKLINHFVSEKTKQKIKEKRKLQIITEDTKRKLSNSLHGRKGIIPSTEVRQKMSDAKRGKSSNRKGIKLSEEIRKKFRIARLKRLTDLGISFSIDEGAPEFFNQINNSKVCHFTQNFRLKSLGYVVDGYEESKHIILEYDTPYHKKPCQIVKDKQREENIIKYFEQQGTPLSYFIRVDASDKMDLKLNVIYQKNF